MEERYKESFTVGIILQKENKILMIKRKNTGYMDGMYAFVEGHLEANESLRQAMVREALEEAGIKILEENLKFVCAIRRNNGYTNYFFSCDKFEGEPQIMEEDKCDEMKWFEIDNMPQNTIISEKRAIYNLKNGIYLDEINF